MGKIYMCYAACSFGLESVVAGELRRLGAEEVAARDARVYFRADEAGVARANLWLSAADRVYVVLKEFEAVTFDQLFEGVKAVPWQEWLSRDAKFPVQADSVHSVLKSVPDIQAISKKAVVESLKQAYGLSFYKESGAEYGIYVSLLGDRASVCLNASGIGLNRRGYRVRNVEAPLRETLAAGIIRLSRWREYPFYDICCGSGTIAIEAALLAKNQAPGIRREFGAEKWSAAFARAFEEERKAARDAMTPAARAPIFASDIDPKMVDTAMFHARRAGVLDQIEFSRADAAAFAPREERGALVINPPYAIRIGEQKEVHALYKALGRRLIPLAGFTSHILSADQEFERAFGKRADKRRKVYNGNIRCCLYQYYR